MPSIQIDLPLTASLAHKQRLAHRVGLAYGEIMQVGMDLLTVSVHDVGEGGVWRCHEDGEPTVSGLIMCDVRRGRDVATRARLAQALIDVCADEFDLDGLWLKVEFTQHAGDEMYHPHLGGFNVDWTGDERAGDETAGGATAPARATVRPAPPSGTGR